MVDQKQLKDLFMLKHGVLYCKIKCKPVGHINKSNGYLQITIKGKKFYAHRLIYIWHYGKIKKGRYVDHKDHNRLNNKKKNLRLVTHLENSKNTSIRKDNKSGMVGVSFCKSTEKWRVNINHNGKCINLGRYKYINEAIEVRKKANKRYNYHKNHGS